MSLRCVSPYKSVFRYQPVSLEPGQLIEDAELEAFLLVDSPRSFESVVKETGAEANAQPVASEAGTVANAKAVEAAPADKMVKASTRKGARRG